MGEGDRGKSTGQAEQTMLLRTWPGTKLLLGTVTTAGTPITIDMGPVVGRTCFFKAVGGDVFGLTFQDGGSVPTVVATEDFTIADSVTGGLSEELFVWGDENLRLRLDASADGTKLFALFDDTP